MRASQDHESSHTVELVEVVEQDVFGTVQRAVWRPDGGQPEPVLARVFEAGTVTEKEFLEVSERRRRRLATCTSSQVLTSLGQEVVDGRAIDILPDATSLSLASFLRRAVANRQAFPLQIALFISDRVASALAGICQLGDDEEELSHGFLTPHWVRISSRGRVQLSGIEIAPALHGFRGNTPEISQILPYLSPESLESGQPRPEDDVYSLASLLYELLTLQPFASPADLRFDDDKIPDSLRYFLARSVAPRAGRIPSIFPWARELKTLIIDEGWTTSSRKVAAFFADLEGLPPTKPDTTEITASDRRAVAAVLRAARKTASSKHSEPAPPTDPAGESGSSLSESGEEGGYQTMAVSKDILEPPCDDSKADTKAP